MTQAGSGGATFGNPEARRIADEALGVFAEVLRPIAEERYLAAYGSTWRKDRGFRSDVIGAQVHSTADPQELLARLHPSPEFDKVFGPLLDVATGPVFGLARDLKAHRNDLYHRTRPWEAADAWRLVDRVEALLDAFGLLTGVARDNLAELARDSAAIVAGDRSAEIEKLRHEYAESVLARTNLIDLGGINARVGSRVVKVRLEDVYVEPQLVAVDDEANPDDSLTLEDLRRTRLTVVLGGPGAGKSTLTRRLARMLVVGDPGDSPKSTPILVEAGEIAECVRVEPEISLRRYVTQRLSERFGGLFADELELGRATLLVDGMDEIADEALRWRVASLVGSFSHEYPNVRLVATSRIVGYRRPASWSNFVELKIAPFDDEQIAEFVGRWVRILKDPDAGDPDGRGLIEDIARSRATRELAETPLLLTILVLLWDRGGRLPERLAELYDLATTTLLRDWPAHRMGRSFDDRRMLAFLRPVAFDLVARGVSTATESDLLGRWEVAFAELEGLEAPREARERASQLLRLIQEHTGFFVEVGREAGERRYGFLHKTFAEYLAALELAEQWDSGDLDLARYLHALRWRNVVELFAGHVGMRGQAAASRLVEEILVAETPVERYLQRNVPLVVRLMKRGLEVRPQLRHAVVRRAIQEVLDPSLESSRVDRGLELAELARTVPASLIDAHTAANPDEPLGRLARKNWLRLLVRPHSDDCLEGFLRSLSALLLGSIAAKEDAGSAMHAIGVAVGVDEAAMTSCNLRVSDAWCSADDAAVERLLRAGVPRYAVSEIAAAARQGADLPEAWLVDYDSFGQATIDEIVFLLQHIDVYWPIVYRVVDDLEWQDAHIAEIESLVDRVSGLKPEVAGYALVAIDVLEPGSARDAWARVLHAMIAEGGSEARQVALGLYLTSRLSSSEDVKQVIARAVQRDPISIRAVPIALGAARGDPGHWMVEMCEQIALDDPDAIARGLARRALGVRVHMDRPLGILSSPDVAVPAGAIAFLPSELDTTGELLSVLMSEAGSDEAQSTAGAIARRVIEAGTYVEYDLAVGEHDVSNMPFDRLARELARSTRPEARRWAARILEALDRGPAPIELGNLLVDPDARVRNLALGAIQEVDIREADWLVDALLRCLEIGADPDPIFQLFRLSESLPTPTIDDLALLTQAFLDDHPGHRGAGILLEWVMEEAIARRAEDSDEPA